MIFTRTTNIARPKRPHRISFLWKLIVYILRRGSTYFATGSFELIRSGKGMHIIMRSELILRIVLVIRWWSAAEH